MFCRPTRKKYALQLRPFWSYYQIFVLHKKKMPGMILRNILMLFPLGLLFPACTGGRSGALKQLIPLSLGISYGIELLQLLLRRGTFELVDDPFHNLLGAFLGCGVYCLLLRLTGKGRNAGQKTG